MKLKRKTLPEEECDFEFVKSEGYKWAIVYNFDEVKMGLYEEMNLDSDMLMQARLFNENKELNIVREAGNINFYFLEDEENDKFIDDSYLVIEKKFDDFKKIHVKKYVKYDEDEQAFISYLRPYKLV